MSRRISKPHLPRQPQHKYRVAAIWISIENVYRCWRDFPELRLGEFLLKAIAEKFNVRDPELMGPTLFHASEWTIELSCYYYWLKHSGRASKRQLKELTAFEEGKR